MKYKCSLIAVQDIKASRDFYENLLGQKVEYDFGENVSFEGGFAIHLADHFQSLIGKENSPNSIMWKANNFELYFESDEIDSILNKLKDYKVEFIHEIREQPWGQRVFRFYDLDHHIIEAAPEKLQGYLMLSWLPQSRTMLWNQMIGKVWYKIILKGCSQLINATYTLIMKMFKMWK